VVPELELSELKQPFGRTHFHECSSLGSEVVWGEWRSEAWALPKRTDIAASSPTTPAPQQALQLGEPAALDADLLSLLALVLAGQRQDQVNSIERLRLLVDLSQHAQLVLKQLEQRCLEHSLQQTKVSSGSQSSSSSTAQAPNTHAHNVSLGSVIDPDLGALGTWQALSNSMMCHDLAGQGSGVGSVDLETLRTRCPVLPPPSMSPWTAQSHMSFGL